MCRTDRFVPRSTRKAGTGAVAATTAAAVMTPEADTIPAMIMMIAAAAMIAAAVTRMAIMAPAAAAAVAGGPAAAKAAATVPAGRSGTSSRVWTKAKPRRAEDWAAVADQRAAQDTNDMTPNADPRVGEQT
jgi:hypothetical protein